MELPAWVVNWKALLGSLAAVLVLVLQILQLLLSSNIEHTLDNKTAALQQKTDAITNTLSGHKEVSLENHELIIENRQRFDEIARHIQNHLNDLEREVQTKNHKNLTGRK